MPVAQIRGSAAYQSFMKSDATSSSSSTETSTLCSRITPLLRFLPSQLRTYTNICTSANVASAKALLATLRAGVESYLGTKICVADLHMSVGEGTKVDVAVEAFQSTGLRLAMPGQISTGRLAVLAKMDRGRVDATIVGEPSWSIIAVECNSYGFSLGLYTMDDIDILDTVKEQYYLYPPSSEESQGGEPGQLDALKNRLQDFFRQSPEGPDQPITVDHLVIYGELSKDDALYQLLASVLGQNLVQKAHISDSVFDATTQLAKVSYNYMDRPYFETKPALGCRLRSKLYQPVHNDL